MIKFKEKSITPHSTLTERSSMDFKKARKGYDKQQVDDYIKRQTAAYEAANAEQRDRIFALKAENAELQAALQRYADKEDEISRALILAAEKASETEEISRKKYDLEIERLKLFHAKWQSYFNEIISLYPIDKNLAVVSDFSAKMGKILNDRVPAHNNAQADAKPPQPDIFEIKTPTWIHDADAPFTREKPKTVKGSPAAKINIKVVDAQKQFEKERKRLADDGGDGAAAEGDGKFDINEALNPKQDLKEILKDLGIN